MDFIKVTKENLEIVYRVQKEIFTESPDALHIKMSILSESNSFNYWLITDGGIPIGISGTYTVKIDPKTIWLSWFGILPQYRNQGFGKKALITTIQKCKKMNRFKFFRLHTSSVYNIEALPLYDSVMEIKELYTNEDDYTFDNSALVYSISLDGSNIEKWDNRYMEIKELEKIAEDGEFLIKKDYDLFFDF